MKNPFVQISKWYFHYSLVPRNPKWKKLRDAHLKKEYWCKYCGNLSNLEVHHVKPFHLYPQLELDPSNLITLCESFTCSKGTLSNQCHLIQGHLGKWININPNIRKIAKISMPKS